MEETTLCQNSRDDSCGMFKKRQKIGTPQLSSVTGDYRMVDPWLRRFISDLKLSLVRHPRFYLTCLFVMTASILVMTTILSHAQTNRDGNMVTSLSSVTLVGLPLKRSLAESRKMVETTQSPEVSVQRQSSVGYAEAEELSNASDERSKKLENLLSKVFERRLQKRRESQRSNSVSRQEVSFQETDSRTDCYCTLAKGKCIPKEKCLGLVSVLVTLGVIVVIGLGCCLQLTLGWEESSDMRREEKMLQESCLLTGRRIEGTASTGTDLSRKGKQIDESTLQNVGEAQNVDKELVID